MITGVFIRHNGKVYTLPKPNRHHDVIRHIATETGVERVDYDPKFGSGFVDENGKLYTRKAAWGHAEDAKQLLPRAPTDHRGGTLYSEDVW